MTLSSEGVIVYLPSAGLADATPLITVRLFVSLIIIDSVLVVVRNILLIAPSPCSKPDIIVFAMR